MIEYLNKTGLSFESGQKLSAASLAKMNDTINDLVDAVNTLLSGICDINQELRDPVRTFTLGEAIEVVSNNRRARGMKIRFLGDAGKYMEYSFIGTGLDDATWKNEENWESGPDVIDGGEW